MATLLPTLDLGQPLLSSTSSENLTARIYVDCSDNSVVRLPQVQPKTGGLEGKDHYDACKKGPPKRNKAAVLTPLEVPEDNLCFSDSDSDSDSSCSSYSSSESESRWNSVKTVADHLRHLSTHSISQETIPDTDVPSIRPVVSSAVESRSVKVMKSHVASDLLHRNHHILLHHGQTALNAHMQITVKSKAATEIAAHAVVTEIPALLAGHRNRAHLSALEGYLHPLGAPAISPKGLAVNHFAGHGAPPLHRNSTGLMSPSPLLSPSSALHRSSLHSAHANRSSVALVRTPVHRTRSIRGTSPTPHSLSPSPSPHSSLKMKDK
uniref:Uncharacterized protein n=1 Tax=Spumella elongata TaxID=89044 RepID=A0A7S3GPR4_9STRA